MKNNMKKLSILLVFCFGIIFNTMAQEEITTASGLKITILKEGKGEKPKNGAKVWVNYIGTLASNGKEFDNSEGYPINFVLGKKEVIAGWEEAVALLNKGAKAKIYIPAHLAYGEKGFPMPEGAGISIPPNADLIFEIELTKFK